MAQDSELSLSEQGSGYTSEGDSRYGLHWNPRPHRVPQFAALCAILTAFSIVISWLAVLAVPGGFLGVGALYFASIYYAITTYWFGGWGVVSSFVGAIVGAGILTGMPLLVAIPFGVADIWEPLLPFLLFRTIGKALGFEPLGGNITSSTRRYILFIPFGAILPPLLSGLWGIWILVVAGFVQPEAYWYGVMSWSIGAALLLALFVPPICRIFSPFLRQRDLACHGIWS